MDKINNMAKKKQVEEPELWVEEQEEVKKVVKTKKVRSGGYSKGVGNRYELKIVKELKELTGDQELATARAESKSLDAAKIDIYDYNNTLPFYIQCKATQNVPQIKNLNATVGKIDKPLAIFWNCREKREVNIISVGEYVILPKDILYTLLRSYLNEKT